MKRITEDDLRAEPFEFLWRHRLHRAVRADRYEGRRVHHTVCKAQLTAAGDAVGDQSLKLHLRLWPVLIITSRDVSSCYASCKAAVIRLLCASGSNSSRIQRKRLYVITVLRYA